MLVWVSMVSVIDRNFFVHLFQDFSNSFFIFINIQLDFWIFGYSSSQNHNIGAHENHLVILPPHIHSSSYSLRMASSLSSQRRKMILNEHHSGFCHLTFSVIPETTIKINTIESTIKIQSFFFTSRF